MVNPRPLKTSQPAAPPRKVAAICAVGLTTALLALAALSPASLDARATDSRRLGEATAARVLNATDTARLRYQRSSGSLILETGTAVGKLPGAVNVRLDAGPTVTATFTLYPKGGGSISGHGSGALHTSTLYSSFGGTMNVKHGTGRYRNAHGQGGFYGTINRKTYALVIQITGTLNY